MKQFRLEINRDKCKGCGLCLHFCPKGVLGTDSEVNAKGYHAAAVVDQGACIGCTSCALMCPDCCITIYEEEQA